MGNKDTKQFMSNIIDITRDEQNTIERKNVFGKMGRNCMNEPNGKTNVKVYSTKNTKLQRLLQTQLIWTLL